MGPDIILRMRISVSLADPDRGVEKGVRGILLFIAVSFLFSEEVAHPYCRA